MKFGNNENWNGHLKTDIEKCKFSNDDKFARILLKKGTIQKKYLKTLKFFKKNWIL